MREWVNSKKALKKVLKVEKCQSIYNVGIWQAHKSFHRVTVAIHKVRWQGLGSPVLSESNWLLGEWIPPLWCGKKPKYWSHPVWFQNPSCALNLSLSSTWRRSDMYVPCWWLYFEGFFGLWLCLLWIYVLHIGALSSSIEKPAQDYLNLRNTKAHQSNNLFGISLNCKILKYLQCKFSLSLSHRLQLQCYCASLNICSYCKIPKHKEQPTVPFQTVFCLYINSPNKSQWGCHCSTAGSAPPWAEEHG